MQGVYTYIPETNYVPREYSVAAILLLLFMVLISLVSVLNLYYYYYLLQLSSHSVAVVLTLITNMNKYIFIYCILQEKGDGKQSTHLHFISFYLPLDDFCIDMA